MIGRGSDVLPDRGNIYVQQRGERVDFVKADLGLPILLQAVRLLYCPSCPARPGCPKSNLMSPLYGCSFGAVPRDTP